MLWFDSKWKTDNRSCNEDAGPAMVRLEGFEPPTHGLEGRCSIRLSYRRPVFIRLAEAPVGGASLR